METITRLFGLIAFLVFSAAFSQDGTLDTSFDSDGILLPVYGSLESENIFIRIQPDGRLITLETVSAHGGNPQYYLRRFNSSGFHDSTFGTGGQVVSNYNALAPRALALDVQSDGKILISGYLAGTDGGAFITRFNVDGSSDSAFGVSGTVIIPSQSWPSSFTTLAGGKMLISHGLYGSPKLSRINSNGILDSSFGTDGSIDIPALGQLAIQPDGKILVCRGGGDYMFTRYLSNGTLDTTYGISGTLILNIDDNDFLSSVGMQSDGKTVFVGTSSNSTTNAQNYNLIRLTSGGGLDSSFGTGGKMSLPFRPGALEFQNDGKIVIAGAELSPNNWNKMAVGRVLANGSMDPSFGTAGVTITSLGDSVGGSATDIKVGADGKITIGGTFCEAFLSCHPHSFVARYTMGALSNPEFENQRISFLAYPNPVNQVVNIDFNLDQSEVLSIDLFDMNGRKISNLLNNENFQSGSNSQKLDLPASLSHGVYFLNISDGRKMTTVKIIK